MSAKFEYYECCIHCDDCGPRADLHRFPCNKCQGRPT